ncbi:MAG: hypothetical protein ACYC41_07295 [Bacillota bacterium]
MPVTLLELAFDLTTKDGQALEETVVRLLQRGASGLQTVLRACSDPASGGRVKAAVAGASARVAEAFAELPAKARDGAGSRLLELLRPEVLEAKGHEILNRGAEEPARQFAQVLAGTAGFAGAARRLETACAMRAGKLGQALSLARGSGPEEDSALVPMLLAQGRRFIEAADELKGVAGAGDKAARVLAAIFDLVPAGDPERTLARLIDRLAASEGLDLASVGRAAVEDYLGLRSGEASAGVDDAIGALRSLGGTFGRVEEAGRQAGAANWIDGVGAAGLPGALTKSVDRVREAVAPYVPAAAEPVDARSIIEEAAGGQAIRTAGDQTPVCADRWLATTALGLVLSQAAEVAGGRRLALEVRTAEGGMAVMAITPEPGDEPDSQAPWSFHPILTGPGDDLPAGPARSFRVARGLVTAFGGDVHWLPARQGEGSAPFEPWAVEVVFPARCEPAPVPEAHPAPTAPQSGGVDVPGVAATVAASLSSREPGTAFAGALGQAVSTLVGSITGEVMDVVSAELPGLAEAAQVLSNALRGPAGDEPGGPEAVSRAAGSARRRVTAALIRLGRGGEQGDTYGDLNGTASMALGDVEPVARGLGAGLVFLPAAELPRLQLDRGLVAAAVSTLAEEAVRTAGRGGEVRVTVVYRGDEAVAELRLESPMVTAFSPLAKDLAGQVAARHGGSLAFGPHGTDVTISFTVSDEERRLARSLPGYARLSTESRRALRTAEAVAAAPSAADPGLRPFLWFKAAEMETKVRLVAGLQRHRYLPAALDALEGGKSRLSRGGEARLAVVVAALPEEDPRLLRDRLVTATEAVTGDRLERVLGDLRSLGVFIAAYGLPGVATGVSAALGRRLFQLGGFNPAEGPDPDVSRAVLQALLALEGPESP